MSNRTQMTVTIPPDVQKGLEKLVANPPKEFAEQFRHVTRSDFVRSALREFIRKYEKRGELKK